MLRAIDIGYYAAAFLAFAWLTITIGGCWQDPVYVDATLLPPSERKVSPWQ